MTDDTTKCTVREIEKDDVQHVVQMIQRLAEQHHDVSKAQSADLLKYAFGPHKISTIWVAEHGNDLVGFIEANYAVNYPEQLFHVHVNLIYVREEYRQQGVALELIQTVVRDSMRLGCNSLLIEAYSTNEAANRFYQSIGLHNRKSTFITLSKYKADCDTMKRILELQRKIN